MNILFSSPRFRLEVWIGPRCSNLDWELLSEVILQQNNPFPGRLLWVQQILELRTISAVGLLYPTGWNSLQWSEFIPTQWWRLFFKLLFHTSFYLTKLNRLLEKEKQSINRKILFFLNNSGIYGNASLVIISFRVPWDMRTSYYICNIFSGLDNPNNA